MGGAAYTAYQVDVHLQFAVHERATHINDFNVHDDKMSLRIHCYMERTLGDSGVAFTDLRDLMNGTLEFVVDADASYGGCIRTRRSTSGFVSFFQGMHGTKARLKTNCTLLKLICTASAHAEANGTVPAAKFAFDALPILERIFGKARFRFRNDASAAIAAIQKGYSREMKFLRSRQFGINLAFLKQTVGKIIEKADTKFIHGDPMTKNLKTASFEYHKNFSFDILRHYWIS